MKILYFANVRIPTEKAHGLQIMKTAEAFCLSGVAVELIVPRKVNKNLAGVDPFSFYKIQRRFPITKRRSLDPTWLLSLPQGCYIKIQSLCFMTSLFFYLLFKKNKAEYIFYVREEYLLPLLLLFSKRVVWEAHALPRRAKAYLKYWAKCSQLVTISQGLKNNLIQLGLNSQKIIVAPDGVALADFSLDISRSKARAQVGLPADKKIILYAGQLYAWKGAQTLADTAPLLPDCLLVFVGGLGAELEKFCTKNQASSNILILGQKPYAEIPFYLKAADVLVLPNSQETERSKLWTSPLKLFEYLASGTPIVASDLPSLREILNDHNAVLVAPDDCESLKAGIVQVLQNQELSAKIGTQARLDVQNYTWPKRADKIINFLNNHH